MSRTISETYSTFSDAVSRIIALFRTLTKTFTRSESVTAAWGTQKFATAYITDSTTNSTITKRTSNAEVMIE